MQSPDDKPSSKSKYQDEADAIRKRATLRGAKAVVVIVMGEPDAMGLALSCDPEILVEVRAGLPSLLNDIAKSVQKQNRLSPDMTPSAPADKAN